MPGKPDPDNAALDDALFVPRLERMTLPEGADSEAGPSYGDVIETICGTTDDSQPVEQYDGTLGVTTAFVAAHQHPVAQVQWNDNLGSVYNSPGDVNGVRWGTGTMIGPDLFITAGHLFDSTPTGWTIPRQNGTNSPLSPQDAALAMHLNFEYQVDPSGTQRAEQRFPITSLIEYRLGGVDFALCRIGGSPGNTYGWTEFATVDAAVGNMLAIIGHPAGHPKRIEAGPATALSGGRLSYNDIDTLGGNSGSGILQSPSGRLVGVHTNGGCNSAGTGSNFGSSIGAILAASPTLRSITPSTHTTFGDDTYVTAYGQDPHTTYNALDQLDTALAKDVATASAGDQHWTHSGLDNLHTPIAADSLGTLLGGDLGTIAGGDDPNNTLAETIFTLAEGIIDIGDIAVDPVIFQRGGRIGRPFVQAGPSMPMGREATSGSASASPALAELEAAISAHTAVLASLHAVHAAMSDGQG